MIGPTVGALCLGLVMGWLVRYFLDRFTQFNAKALGSVASVLAGGVILKLLPDPFRYAGWFYPVGLLFGVVLYPVMSYLEQSLFSARSRTLPGENVCGALLLAKGQRNPRNRPVGFRRTVASDTSWYV